MKTLLDTHVLLWWLPDEGKLSAKQRRAVRAASSEEPLLVSDVTLWEIATLVALGCVELDVPLRDGLEQAVAPPLVRVVPISPAIAADVASLPASFHRDPADRTSCRRIARGLRRSSRWIGASRTRSWFPSSLELTGAVSRTPDSDSFALRKKTGCELQTISRRLHSSPG